jgi:hypothetical protein
MQGSAQHIVEQAEEYALAEIEKYGTPPLLLFHAANKRGDGLAKQLGADIEIVRIGMRLMDIKAGEALAQGRSAQHVAMSVTAAREFLAKFDLPQEKLDKILNCVAGHHKTTPWTCIEAEICANADCYKFLAVKEWLAFLNVLGERHNGAEEGLFEKDLAIAEQKADEKWRIVSLDICKRELEPQYRLIKEIITKARAD